MVRSNDRPAMTIAVDLGRKATKQASTQLFHQYMMLFNRTLNLTYMNLRCFEKIELKAKQLLNSIKNLAGVFFIHL